MPVYQYNTKNNKFWKFRVYIKDPTGKNRQIERRGFKTKKEAQNAEMIFKLKYQEKINSITFYELYLSYIKHQENNLKHQSYRKMISIFKNHLLPYFKDYKIDKITPLVYDNWKNMIDKKEYKYKYKTKTNIHNAMVGILNYAIKFYGLKENIASKVGNFKRKNELIKSINFWTLEEFNCFINNVDDFVYKIFFTTLYFTGLRQGEALALTWNDLGNGYLDINKTISKETINGKHIINTPKTKSSIRQVYLDKKIYSQLIQLKEFYKNQIGFNNNWFIFGGITPLSSSTIGRKKDTWCEISNIKKIRIHDFRHSHASLLLSNGIPITAISQRLGHSKLSMTLDIYSHLLPQDEDKVIQLLDNL